jgi:hypothetical protein
MVEIGFDLRAEAGAELLRVEAEEEREEGVKHVAITSGGPSG